MREIDHFVALPGSRAGRVVIATRAARAPVVEVRGCLLAEQFELAGGGWLLWLTDDSPHDEGLHVHLLDAAGTVEDSLEAGADFAAGILKFQRIGEQAVEFGFFLNDVTYRLEVGTLPRRQFRLPAGWKYEHRFRRHRLFVSVLPTTHKA